MVISSRCLIVTILWYHFFTALQSDADLTITLLVTAKTVYRMLCQKCSSTFITMLQWCL